MSISRPIAPDRWFYLALPGVVLLTFAVHEMAHWLAGEALGHDMRMSLNGAFAVQGRPMLARDAILITAAGPAVTLIQALLAFQLVESRRLLWAYAFLFVAFFMRLAAATVSVVHPNDEARLSLSLGWGAWPLPVIVLAGLLALTWVASHSLKLGWKTNVLSCLISTVSVTAIVLLAMIR